MLSLLLSENPRPISFLLVFFPFSLEVQGLIKSQLTPYFVHALHVPVRPALPVPVTSLPSPSLSSRWGRGRWSADLIHNSNFVIQHFIVKTHSEIFFSSTTKSKTDLNNSLFIKTMFNLLPNIIPLLPAEFRGLVVDVEVFV